MERNSYLSKKYLVTGVAGSIGDAVTQLFNEAGIGLIGFDRVKCANEALAVFEDYQVGDIRDERALDKNVERTDGVVHLAGWVHMVPCTKKDKEDLYEINYVATRSLARMCKERKKALVFVSTVAVHGDASTGRLGEESAVSPSTAYAHSKLLAESAVIDAGGTVLRFPMVYGAGDKGNMARMIRAIRNGWFFVPGDGGGLRSFVSRWNAAQAIKIALENDKAKGQIYLATDDEDISLGTLCDLCAEFCGCRRPIRVPLNLAAAAAITGSMVRKVTRLKMPIDLDVFRKLTKSLTFDCGRIKEELGYQPIQTLRQGLKEEVDWLLKIDFQSPGGLRSER